MVELYRMKEITEMNPAQQTMWISRKMPEELYDLENDPHEIHNLAGDPRYRETLLLFRKVMKDWMIRTCDAGLMPEGYILENLDDNTTYELARSKEIYPIGRILEVADMILENSIEQDKLSAKLDDDHELIRFWAVICLSHLQNPSSRTLKKLNEAISDSSLYVRLAAADALCIFNLCNEKAQMAILEGLKSERMIDVLVAARIFELHAEKMPLIKEDAGEVRQFLMQVTEEGQWKGYDINALWALNEAFNKLD
jgi:hypothetical protein